MAIRRVILIPGGDPGDKRTVAFGASENSRPIGYLRIPVSVEIERLVSHSWCRKMMKAGSCRSTDVTKLLQKQRRYSQCNGIGLCRILSTGKTSVFIYRGTYRVGNSAVTPEIFFFRLAASQSPSKIWRAAAGKIVTRRLISRIILESVVNASSRRRRGLLSTRSHWYIMSHNQNCRSLFAEFTLWYFYTRDATYRLGREPVVRLSVRNLVYVLERLTFSDVTMSTARDQQCSLLTTQDAERNATQRVNDVQDLEPISQWLVISNSDRLSSGVRYRLKQLLQD